MFELLIIDIKLTELPLKIEYKDSLYSLLAKGVKIKVEFPLKLKLTEFHLKIEKMSLSQISIPIQIFLVFRALI